MSRVEIQVDDVVTRLRASDGVLRTAEHPQLRGIPDAGIARVLPTLLRAAATFASAPISGFNVGAIAIAGAEHERHLYFGANLEIPGEALSLSLHAEQSAVVNAWMHGEPVIASLATSAPPCGYCRQFLFELEGARALNVLTATGQALALRPLTDLLPDAFGPDSLGIEARLLRKPEPLPELRLTPPNDDPLCRRALDEARFSYAPYTGTLAACAFETSAGKQYAGRYVENAAYNPSLSPAQTALSAMQLGRASPEERIERAVLVERAGPVSQRPITERILAAVAPKARLTHHLAQ